MLFNKMVSKADIANANKLAKFNNLKLDKKSLVKVKGGEEKVNDYVVIDDLNNG